MNTLLAGRTLAHDLVQEIRQLFASFFNGTARPDAADDESSTRFSWPRGL